MGWLYHARQNYDLVLIFHLDIKHGIGDPIVCQVDKVWTTMANLGCHLDYI